MVIWIVIGAILLAYVGFWYFCTRTTMIVKVNPSQITDFKYSMKVSGLPVLIMQQGTKSYNFLYDTGSNACYINQGTDIIVKNTNTKSSFMGADGVNISTSLKSATLELGGHKYEHTFNVADLSASFAEVKAQYGVNLHGIIGTDFMSAYNYCIDFKEYVIYCRK